MRGIETRLEKSRGVGDSETWVKEVASSVGVEPIFGETNIRTCIRLDYEKYLLGSALAATALCLSPAISYVGIAAAHPYDDPHHMIMIGSTPLVDEMYSTERMQIFHDGAESNRATKLGRLMEWNQELVLNYLRVCTGNAGGAFNCGRCPKCVRTAIPLHAMGLWDKATTFPDKETSHWEKAVMRDRHLSLIAENLEFVRECGGNEWLVAMLERVIAAR